jgi:hypothetical protein
LATIATKATTQAQAASNTQAATQEAATSTAQG